MLTPARVPTLLVKLSSMISPSPLGRGTEGGAHSYPRHSLQASRLSSTNTPSVLRTAPPLRGSKTSGWPRNAYSGVLVQFLQSFFSDFPPPLWGGGQGEGVPHPTPSTSCCAVSARDVDFQNTPSVALRQLPLAGGAELGRHYGAAISGATVGFDPARQASKCSGAAVYLQSLTDQVPPPHWGGGQGEGGPNPSAALFLTQRCIPTDHPLTPSDSSP